MISSTGTPSSSFGRGWRATLMGMLLSKCNLDANLGSGRRTRQRGRLLRGLPLSGLDQRPDVAGCQRQLERLDAERLQGVGDGVGHAASRRDNAALACAFGPERIDRR